MQRTRARNTALLTIPECGDASLLLRCSFAMVAQDKAQDLAQHDQGGGP